MDTTKLVNLKVITAPPDLSLEAAQTLMQRYRIRHLPVISGQRLAGIVSDRDILLALGRANGASLHPAKSVGEIMSLAPVSAAVNASVQDLAKAMVDSKIDALPIVKGRNELVGLVTSTDLLRILAEMPVESQPRFEFEIHRAADLQAQA